MNAARMRTARAEQRALESAANSVRTRIRLTTFPNGSGLWHALPTRIQQLLPIRTFAFDVDLPITDHIAELTTDTPAGTIHHSGGGLIFDIKAHTAAQSYTTDFAALLAEGQRLGAPSGWCRGNLNSQYFSDCPEFCRHLFGFPSFELVEDFVRDTWGREPDEPGVACRDTFSTVEEFCLALWRMRQRPSNIFLSKFAGTAEKNVSRVVNTWIPRCGAVGRSLVWLPSMDYIKRAVPESFRRSGMESVALIGDCTDILTQTVRKQISVRNQQRSDKSAHSAAMGLSWCTPSGWTAIASDLVLGRTVHRSITQL
mmetsp:Transcript_17144/g.38436  ORF Transcript_17144/g.38436 Transcript_17144/m.38436 type:complete len:313 (-) Transcript_17144:411-1349(-)